MAKCTNISKKVENFEPITLQITLETENEVRDFWSRFVLDGDTLTKAIIKDMECPSVSYDGSINGDIIWEMIDDICIKRDIKG